MRGKRTGYYLRYIKNRIRNILWQGKRTVKEQKRVVRRYPTTIQLPITYKCNFDCIMCGMHHMVARKDLTAKELFDILCDPLFQKVEYIGVNGGEPFIKPDIVECFEAMLQACPNLKTFGVISNGFFTQKILDVLSQVKPLCEKKGVTLNLALSVDGVGKIQDMHRGREGAFEHVNETVDKILQEQKKYVDGLSVICTLTRHNIFYVNEVEAWGNEKKIDISYNIATVNVRIENEDREADFSVFSDEQARMLAQEFFYSKYIQTGEEKYFGLFLYLRDRKRYAPCPCQYNEWVTLTPDSQIGYCATHSRNLGSALETSAYEIFNGNLDYLEELKKDYCKSCSHYLYELSAEGLKQLAEDQRKNIFVRG